MATEVGTTGSINTATLDVIDSKGKKVGSVDLPAEIFDVQTNVPLIHQVVVAQRAAARQGTHNTLRRGEVSGAGRKPFKQKGTGRARQGSIRAPQMTGGGIVHGPHPRDYSQRTPKKMIAAALRGVLSDRARGGRIHVIDSLSVGDVPSTKTSAQQGDGARHTRQRKGHVGAVQGRLQKVDRSPTFVTDPRWPTVPARTRSKSTSARTVPVELTTWTNAEGPPRRTTLARCRGDRI